MTQPPQPLARDDDLDENLDGDLVALLDASADAMPEALRRRTSDTARRVFFGTTAPPAGLRPGHRIGAYEVVGPLGAGGQARVYEARHVQLGRRVALKIPQSAEAADVMREARLASRVEHPHVVRTEDVGEDDGTPFLVMELCSAGSLTERLRAAPEGVPEHEVLEITRAMLRALVCVHDRGVTHRDLKPSNILFDEQGVAKLADLGIGGLHHPSGGDEHWPTIATLQGRFGTPSFMAPEQRERGGTVDGRADLYALGKVLYVMLTGRSPATIVPVSRLRSDLAHDWDEFIFRLVEDDPDRRYPSAAAALADLDELPLRCRDRATPTAEDDTGVALMRRFVTAYLVLLPSLMAVVIWEALRHDSLDEFPILLVPFGVVGWAAIGLAGAFGRRLKRNRSPPTRYLANTVGIVLGAWMVGTLWNSQMFCEGDFSLAQVAVLDAVVAAVALTGYAVGWRLAAPSQ